MTPFKLTDAQLKAWKKDHEEVHEIEVDFNINDKPVTLRCYVKKPEIETLIAANEIDKNEIKQALFIFNNCWLGGDEYIQKDSGARMAAALKTVPLFQIPVARIKKL